MSGIAGIIHFDGAPVTPGMVEKMTAAMVRRGPDGIKHWVEGSVGLGHCMFCTTPESLEETQPHSSEDSSLVLVMDGRVDNWEDLRAELLRRGSVLRNRSDAELVLRAYEAWGEACVDRIIGEFVFFIWDSRRRQLFGARDVVGARHFYYHRGSGWFGFASEIKGLLALKRIELKLNESRLLDYLVPAFQMDDQVGTFYQHIQRLPAGHAMRVTALEVKIWQYWNPGNLPPMSFGSLDECADAFLEQFRVAVKSRIRSIAPVGAALSGGLDSSSIVALINKEFRNELSHPLQTFSLILDDRERCPDWLSIRHMLRDDWIEPTVISSDRSPDFCRTFLDFVSNADEPFAVNNFAGFMAYEAAKANGCRVYLDGGAGDLLFYSGSTTADTIFRRRLYSYLPSVLAAQMRHGGTGRVRGLTWLARSWLAFLAPEGARLAYRRLRGEHALTKGYLELLHPETARRLLATKRAQPSPGKLRFNGGNDQINHARRFTSGSLAFSYELMGEIALSREVEPRSPYSDQRLIEFAIRMPVEAKFFAPWYKYLLRKSMNGILPEEVRWRREMGGHPGWKFWDTALGVMLGSSPECHDLMNLRKWVNIESLGTVLPKPQLGNFLSDLWHFRAAVLSCWLKQHMVF